jgi:hypothetical protein
MGLEDKYPDILQNIEGSIASIYRKNPEMRDVQAVKALDALQAYFRHWHLVESLKILKIWMIYLSQYLSWLFKY